MNQKISQCRIVRAVIRLADGMCVTRPAIAVNVWPGTDTIAATIFMDGQNNGDGYVPLLIHRKSMLYDETGKAEDSWHWPVPPKPEIQNDLLQMAHRLCEEIERLPASEQATTVGVMASELFSRLHVVLQP